MHKDRRLFRLLSTRQFLPLFLTQFFGALSDNVFKNALLIFVTYTIASRLPVSTSIMAAIAGLLFISPFLVFSSIAGQIADKYDKSDVIRYVKIFEVLLMLLTAVSFYYQQVIPLMILLFCTGLQSTLFGPSKYGILPDHLPESDLIAANALINTATFIAILVGSLFGSIVITLESGIEWISLSLCTIASVGYLSSRLIPKSAPAMPSLQIAWEPIQASCSIIREAQKSPLSFRLIICISWFWFIGAIILTQIPTFVKEILNANEHVVALFIALFCVGVSVGAVGCYALLRSYISTRYTPFSCMLMSIGLFDLCLASSPFSHLSSMHVPFTPMELLAMPGGIRIMVDATILSLASGVFAVPLYAALQAYAPTESRARIIACNNILSSFLMILAALLSLVLFSMKMTVLDVFILVGLLNLCFVPYTYKRIRLHESI